MKMQTCLELFAQFAEGIRLDSLPPHVSAGAKRCIREALQNLFASRTSGKPDLRREAALKTASASPGVSGPCRLLGTAHTGSMEDAAFYNGISISSSPRLDCYRPALCHPGSVSVPAAFAAAEAFGKSGKAVLEGIIAGYEAMIRLNLALQTGHISSAVRRTALSASFCGAVTASKVLGLSAEETASAAGLACHFSFGTNEWLLSGTGEDAFQSAWGAKCGIHCARLAAAGATSSPSALEGAQGLFRAYRAEQGAEAFLQNLGKHYLIEEIEHKPVNACLLLQSPCQAAEAVSRKYHPHPETIAEIRIALPGQVLLQSGVSATRVATAGQASNSVPFGVASALLLGNCRHIVWNPPFPENVSKLMERCRLTEAPSFSACFPHSLPVSITLLLKDGRKLSYAQQDYQVLDNQDSLDLTQSTLAVCFGSKQARLQMKLLENFEKIKDVREFTKAFALT